MSIMLTLGKIPRIAKPMSRTISSQDTHIVAGPPRNRISFAEKVIHGIVLSAGILAYPIWTMWDVKNHRLARWEAEAAENN